MKITLVTQYYKPEGQRIPSDLASSLRSLGVDVKVITGYPNYPDGRIFPGYKQRFMSKELIDGIEVTRVPIFISHSDNPIGRIINYFSFSFASMLPLRLMRRADVNYVYAAQMTAALAPFLVKILFKVPYILHVQDIWPESITESKMVPNWARKSIEITLSPILRMFYRNAACVVGISESMTKLLISRGAEFSNSKTIFNWDPEENLLPNSGGAKNRVKEILYAGNFGVMQDLETFLHAAKLCEGNQNLKFTIIGSGILETKIRQMKNDLNLVNLEILGRVPIEDMEEIKANADFSLISLKDTPIFRRTIPSKFQSSISNGIPVICSVLGELSDIVRANELGFTCSPEDPKSLATVFQKVAKMSNSEVERLRRNASNFYEMNMSRKIAIGSFEKILLRTAKNSE